MTRSAAIARAVALALSGYYLVYSLVAPVIVTDAHLYDLARLYLIRQGGLLHNTVFTFFTQIAFPWTFDAIHWPFVCLGFGYALPSFGCLTGILIITFHNVREAEGVELAWVSVLALLALPTLVYQATSLKSDVAVVFGVFCWFDSLRRYRRAGRRFDLVISALALAFGAGAKTSGVPITVGLGIASIWCLRNEWRRAVEWIGVAVLFAALFASIETYVAAELTFGNYLGPEGLRSLRNNDGLAGAAANLVRHLAYNVDIGADVLAGRKWMLSAAAERACRWMLAVTGLDTKGLVPGFDRPLDFFKAGHEAQDGFGPVGTVAMVMVPAVLARGRVRHAPWQLAAASVVALGIACQTIGFALWVNRFLMLPFALGTLATVLHLAPRWHRSSTFRAGALVVLLYGACVLPMFSFARKPKDIWRSLVDRDAMTTREIPNKLPVLRAVRRLVAACPSSFWLVTSATTAPQFLFYDLLRDRDTFSRPVPVDAALLARVQAEHPGRPIRVLAIDQRLFGNIPGLTELARFPGETPEEFDTQLFRYGQDACGDPGHPTRP